MSDSSGSTGSSGGRRRRAPLVASRRPVEDPDAAEATGAPLFGDGPGDEHDVPDTPSAPAPPVFPPRPPEPAGLRDSDGSWMSPRQAADAAGVPLSTVRKWRKSGTIAERRNPGSGVEVFLTSNHGDPERPGAVPTPSPPTSELGVLVPLEVYQRSLAELILRLTDTTERAVRAEAEVEHLRQRLAELGSA